MAWTPPNSEEVDPSRIPTSNPTGEPVAPASLPQSTIGGDILAGLKNYGLRGSRGTVDTIAMLGGDPGEALRKTLIKHGITPNDAQLEASQRAVNAGGPMADVSQVGADVLGGAASMYGAGPLLAKGVASMLPRATTAIKSIVEQAPRLTREMLTNASFNAVTAPEAEKGSAAMWGAAAPVIGKTVEKTITGPLRNMITPEAKRLQARGVELTPGMSVTGDNAGYLAEVLRGAEDFAQRVPIIGDFVKRRAAVSAGTGNVAKVNEFLEPLNAKIDSKLAGEKALAAGADKVQTEGYQKALPNLSLDPSKPVHTFNLQHDQTGLPTPQASAGNLIEALDLIKRQYNKNVMHFKGDIGGNIGHDTVAIDDLIHKNLERQMDLATTRGVPLSGSEWKAIDSEVDALARKARGKGDDALAHAYETIQKTIYGQLDESAPGAKTLVRKTDEAYAKMMPVEKAEDNVLRGPWTPRQMRTATNSLKREHTQLDKDLAAVLPDRVSPMDTTSKAFITDALVRGTGGAGAAYAATPMFGMPWLTTPLLGASAVLPLLYNKTGQKYLQEGLPGAQMMIDALKKKGYSEDLAGEIVRKVVTQGTRAEGGYDASR